MANRVSEQQLLCEANDFNRRYGTVIELVSKGLRSAGSFLSDTQTIDGCAEQTSYAASNVLTKMCRDAIFALHTEPTVFFRADKKTPLITETNFADKWLPQIHASLKIAHNHGRHMNSNAPFSAGEKKGVLLAKLLMDECGQRLAADYISLQKNIDSYRKHRKQHPLPKARAALKSLKRIGAPKELAN